MSLVNKSQLAEILGKTPQTLTTWQKNGMPIFAEGRNGQSHQYETADVIQWLISREIGKLTIDSDGVVHDYEMERARLTHHQANKVSLEERVLSGELIHANTVSEVQTKMLSAFRAKCLSIPTKTAPRVVYLSDLAEVEGELRQSIYDALSELSEFKPEQYGISVVREDSADDCSTAEPDS